MGVFSRFTRFPPATATDPVVGTSTTESPIDEEKAVERSLGEHTEVQPNSAHIEPEIEKRVVRKLDIHAMPLIAVLCMVLLHAFV